MNAKNYFPKKRSTLLKLFEPFMNINNSITVVFLKNKKITKYEMRPKSHTPLALAPVANGLLRH